MRMNARGLMLTGLGRAWLTDDLWATQIGADAAGWKTIASNSEVLDEQGFNTLCAGNGKWATWLNGRGPKGNFGPLDPAGIVMDIGPDGTVLWCPSQQAGSPIGVLGGPLFPIIALTLRVCGPGHFVAALADGRIWSNLLGYATIPAGVTPFKAHVIGDKLLYHTHEHLVFQLFTQPRGIVVAEKPAYSPDMVRVPGGYKVAWCLNEAETDTAQRFVADTDAFTDLSGLRDVPLVVIDPPPVEPTMQAPNQIAVVRSVMADHPEIDTTREATRGHILPHILRALGGAPWGRKSRNAAGTDLNTDAVTFRRTDGRFEIYDVIDGTTGKAAWDAYGPFAQGENGYWVAGVDAIDPPPVPDGPPSETLTVWRSVLAGWALLEARIEALEKHVAALRAVKPVEQTPLVLTGRRIALRTDNGHYVGAENGGGGTVYADRTTVGGWETFTLEEQ